MRVFRLARHPVSLRKTPDNCHVFGAFSGCQTACSKTLFSLATAVFLLLPRGGHAQVPEAGVLVLGFAPLQPSAAAVVAGVTLDRVFDVASYREQRARQAAHRQLEQLSAADAAVARAKSALAILDESRALHELSYAEATLSRTLALPGVTVFYAEVQLQLGMCAAQLGLIDVAEAAFARAARVEAGRRLLTGEAAPEVVALAQRAFERVRSAAEGELRISVNAPDARVFVDDNALGRAPLVLHARAGVHVLRIEAEGFATYASLFDVVEGRRPEQHFELSPVLSDAAVSRFETARAHAEPRELAAATRALLAEAPELRVLVFSEQDVAGQRSLLVVCDARGCRAPLRRSAKQHETSAGSGLATVPYSASMAALSVESLREARAWLAGDVTQEPRPIAAADALETPVWQRWYVWTALSAAAIGAALAIGVAAWPAPERGVRVTVDPSALR